MSLTVTLVIILITTGISLYAQENAAIKAKLLFNPYSVTHQKKWYKVISHAFIHADFVHLFFNMFVLFQFGKGVESFFIERYGVELGILYYLLLYLGGVLFATLPAFYKHSDNHHYNSLGASGAVSSVLFAAIIIHPFFIEIYFIPAIIFGPLYLYYEYYMSKKGRSNVAHDAHIAGAIFGLIFILIFYFNNFIDNFIFEFDYVMNR